MNKFFSVYQKQVQVRKKAVNHIILMMKTMTFGAKLIKHQVTTNLSLKYEIEHKY